MGLFFGNGNRSGFDFGFGDLGLGCGKACGKVGKGVGICYGGFCGKVRWGFGGGVGTSLRDEK